MDVHRRQEVNTKQTPRTDLGIRGCLPLCRYRLRQRPPQPDLLSERVSLGAGVIKCRLTILQVLILINSIMSIQKYNYVIQYKLNDNFCFVV